MEVSGNFSVVDHLCHKCNEPVETGRPFCSKCGAPQIRVTVPEHPLPAIPPAATLEQNRSDRVQWSAVVPAAALAGIASVVVVNVIALVSPLLAVLSVALVGVVAALFYSRKRELALSTTTGLKIGMVAGFFAFLAHGTLALIQFVSNPQLLAQELRKAMEQTTVANAQTRQMMERMLSPEGIVVFVVLIFIVMLVLFMGLGSIGGVIAASLSRRRQRSRHF
jgi:hypothetical protein